ncbi:hypothetical protein RBH29_12220 [Herbivorax sp. ANBcel31]|uniref:hypothetical protein n=1 Tax=Herbivorax sp. ANBcel31 TaxID=3069754 RepID=UPI0027AEFC08|nr:hypothetical protein [Herbivorax sp. ANBcel31]MDQ2087193.1 hypothetical protein [Herbivorax sp. ANBcel31]
MINLRVKDLFSIILLVFVFAISTISHASPDEDLEISIRAGFNDVARIYSECPFYFEIENNGEDIEGEIQIHRSLDRRTKVNYAIPFDLPEGSRKEFVMNVPINTVEKDVEVKIISENETLISTEYQFEKIIAPENPVIGLLTDDVAGFESLYNVNLSENLVTRFDGSFQSQMMSPRITPDSNNVKRSAEIIELDDNNFPDNEKLLGSFDIIIISDYDTNLLSSSQNDALKKWVSEGNILVIGTGENTRKVYSGLDESLRPFKIDGQERIQMPEDFADFTERAIPEEQIYVSTGSVENGDIIIGDEDNALAINYKHGNGNIFVLAFDPASTSISDWDYSKDMWERLLEYNVSGDSSVKIDHYNYHQNYINRFSVEDGFPFGLLYTIIIIYIILAGPILYWILKSKDKRDFSWIIIPSLAFLFLGIVYVGGYSTRYGAAVINNYSLINLDSETQKMHVNSSMGIYNNKKGTLKLEYPSNYSLDVFLTNQHYHHMHHEVDQDIDVTNKVLLGEPEIHEIYDVPLWESVNAGINVTKEYEGEIIKDIDIEDSEVSGVIKNNTSFSLKDSYIVLDGRFISVGDINPGDEKKLEVDLNDSSIKSEFNLFMNELYPGTSNLNTPSNMSNDERQKQREKREIFQMAYNDFIQRESRLDGKQIAFFALNYENINYELKVNEKTAKTYNTNVIYTVKNVIYEKGENITLQKGAIRPVLENEADFIRQEYMLYIFHEDKEAEFSFSIKRNLDVEQFEIDWSKVEYHHFYTDETVENKMDSYDLYIKNNSTDEWEEMDTIFRVDTNIEDYLDRLNKVRVKADITFTENHYGHDFLVIPEIQVSGVVK